MERQKLGVQPKTNVELVLALYEHFNQRDEEALLDLYDEGAEVRSFVAAVEGSNVFRGREGVRAWYQNLVGTLGMLIEPGELLAYRRLVLSIPKIHVRTGQDEESSFEQGIVYEIRDGRIHRSFGHQDAATALITMGELLKGTHTPAS
jgi:SnoaL-like protein